MNLNLLNMLIKKKHYNHCHNNYLGFKSLEAGRIFVPGIFLDILWSFG